MLLPIQITFRNMERDEKVEEEIRAQAEKLERYCDYITSCRVLVELTGGRRRGNQCHVRIDLGLPGRELVVEREPSLYADAQLEARVEATKELEPNREHRKPQRAVRDAFAEMRRRLQDCVRRQRGAVKQSVDGRQSATVIELDPEQHCGFCLADDTGERVYFHRNSVVDARFDQLRIGTKVKVVAVPGEKGPQATAVHIADRKANRQKAEGTALVPPAGRRRTAGAQKLQ